MKNIFENVEGFQWDKGNIDKNWLKHHILHIECEQIFFNDPLIITDDLNHSQTEKRWFALGRTETDRKLFVVFTMRKNLIRVISARDMNKKERRKFNEETKKNTEI
jgi:uncharacterized DUF497 family protein